MQTHESLRWIVATVQQVPELVGWGGKVNRLGMGGKEVCMDLAVQASKQEGCSTITLKQSGVSVSLQCAL